MAQTQFRDDDTEAWSEKYGNGSDGAKTVSSNSTDDSPNSTLTGTVGGTAATIGDFTGFADGDLVLIHQSRGSGAGGWELNKITSHSGLNLTMRSNLKNTYVAGAQIIKLRQYSSVTVNSGITWSAPEWDGNKGGILAYLCDGTTTITGNIDSRNKGFRAAAGSNPTGTQGEGHPGTGAASNAANGNGGGGGTYGGSGGTGGDAVGVASLITIFFGGASGGGGGSSTVGVDGAGAIIIISANIEVTGTVNGNGTAGSNGVADNAATGGSAGGAILFKGDVIVLGTNLVTATAGAAGTGGGSNPRGSGGGGHATVGGNGGSPNGGIGSVGRIHADYGTSISGTTNPALDSAQHSVLVGTSAPTVTTDNVTNITSSTALASGNVTDDGGAAITERGFVYSTNANPTTSNSKKTVSGTTGAFTGTITGLSPNTIYHVRAYAINSIGTSYGTDIPFTTANIPIIVTKKASNIRRTKANITFNVAGGIDSVTEMGVVYSTGISPTTSDSKKTITPALGDLTLELTGLSPNTRYFVRAYYINSDGTTYVNTISFLTASLKVLKHYFYKVYDATTGAFVNTWSEEVISDPSFKMNINGGASDLTIKLSRKFDDFGEDVDVKLNNKVECWMVDEDNHDGVLLYSGYISGYQPQLNGPSEYIEVTVFNFVAELSKIVLRDSSGNTTIAYNSYSPEAILRDVIDKYRRLEGKINYSSTSIGITNQIVSYTFNTNTIKECLDKIIELCPVGWYYRIDPDNTIYLQPKNILSDHIFTLGLNVEKLSTFRRIEDIVNRVLFTGGGDPPLFRKVENTSSQATYGLYEKLVVDQRVTEADTAAIMAQRIVDAQKDPEIRSIFEIIDNNGPDGDKGYDIETIKPGQTLKVKNLKTSIKTQSEWDRELFDQDVWDQTLATTAADVIQILSVSYAPDSVIIEASSRLPQVSKRIEDVNRNLINSQTVDNPAAPS